MTETSPIRREVRVTVSTDSAFAFFTAHIGAWWPLDSHSVYGEDGLVAFEGDVLVERSGSELSVWAEVVEWDPPHALRLSWHPGGQPADATDVRICFLSDGESTLVTLEHTGWERLADPAAAMEGYSEGWTKVLEVFAGTAAEALFPKARQDLVDEGKTEWFALVHRPGPALADGESIFANPMFKEHVAFLRRLDERGLLVAAGPLVDEAGSGMTVVRVDPRHGHVDMGALATEDDLCVAGGYLSVTVRPWAVQFSAG